MHLVSDNAWWSRPHRPRVVVSVCLKMTITHRPRLGADPDFPRRYLLPLVFGLGTRANTPNIMALLLFGVQTRNRRAR